MGKSSLFSKWYWESWTAASKSMKSDHILTQCTKRNSKWLKDLNIRDDTIKLLEESIDKPFSDINHTNVSLVQSPKAIEIKTKINKWNVTKCSRFFLAKETIKKRTTYKMEKIFENDMTHNGLVAKHKNNSFNSKTKNQTIQSNNGHKTLMDISPKKTYRWPIGT